MAVGVATGDEDRLQTPQGTVWSCRVVGESFGLIFNRLLLLMPRAKTTEHLAGFLLLAATEDRRPKFAAN